MRSRLLRIQEHLNRIARIHRAGLIDPDEIKRLVRDIMTARADEIACDECFEQLDTFIAMALSGNTIAKLMPMVQDHLERCGDCREEFEALLITLHSFA